MTTQRVSLQDVASKLLRQGRVRKLKLSAPATRKLLDNAKVRRLVRLAAVKQYFASKKAG